MHGTHNMFIGIFNRISHSLLTKTKQTDLSRNKRNESNVSMYIIQRTGGTISFKNEPRELNRALALAAQTNENSTNTAHSKKKLIHSGFELMTLSSRRNRFLNMTEAQFLKTSHISHNLGNVTFITKLAH